MKLEIKIYIIYISYSNLIFQKNLMSENEHYYLYLNLNFWEFGLKYKWRNTNFYKIFIKFLSIFYQIFIKYYMICQYSYLIIIIRFYYFLKYLFSSFYTYMLDNTLYSNNFNLGIFKIDWIEIKINRFSSNFLKTPTRFIIKICIN